MLSSTPSSPPSSTAPSRGSSDHGDTVLLRHAAFHRDTADWVKSGEIAIPETQRPFVWEATKVRSLLDSLHRGYPVGYLIAWRNPTVKLKDGTPRPASISSSTASSG